MRQTERDREGADRPINRYAERNRYRQACRQIDKEKGRTNKERERRERAKET